MYLIWSNKHSAWWRHASMGYTDDVDMAGRYEHSKALEITSGPYNTLFGRKTVRDIAIAEDDALTQRAEPRPRQAS